MNQISDRLRGFAQSDIRRMSRECERVGGINLGQGICDLPTIPETSCGFDAPVGAMDGSRWWSGTRRHRLQRRIKARPDKGAGRPSRTTDRRPLQRPCRGA
jgi:hypothetical protein